MYTNHPSPLSSEGAEKQQNGIGDHEQASAASSGPVHTPTGHTPTHADPSPGAHPQTHSQQRTGVLLEEHRREVISPCPGHHRDSQGPCFLGVSPLCQPPGPRTHREPCTGPEHLGDRPVPLPGPGLLGPHGPDWKTRGAPAPPACCSSNSCCEEMGFLARNKQKKGFLFLYKWKQNPGEAATPHL